MGCNESRPQQINFDKEMQTLGAKDVQLELDELQKYFMILDSECQKMKISLYLVSELQTYKKLPISHYKSLNLKTEEFYQDADELNQTRNELQRMIQQEFEAMTIFTNLETLINQYGRAPHS